MKIFLLSLVAIIFNLFVLPLKSAENFSSETTQFFNEYIKGYNQYFLNKNDKRAMQDVASHFHIPTQQITNKGTPIIVKESQRLANNLTRFVDNLREKGITQLAWEKIQVKPLTENKALAINIANAINTKGEVVSRLSTLYLISKTEQGWKITTINPHSINNHLEL